MRKVQTYLCNLCRTRCVGDTPTSAFFTHVTSEAHMMAFIVSSNIALSDRSTADLTCFRIE